MWLYRATMLLSVGSPTERAEGERTENKEKYFVFTALSQKKDSKQITKILKKTINRN